MIPELLYETVVGSAVAGCIFVAMTVTVNYVLTLIKRYKTKKRISYNRALLRRRGLAKHERDCQFQLRRRIYNLESDNVCSRGQTITIKGVFATPEAKKYMEGAKWIR